MTSRKHNGSKPTVRLKPSSYQPSKAELEEDVSIDATPEDLRRAVMRPVQVKGRHNAG